MRRGVGSVPRGRRRPPTVVGADGPPELLRDRSEQVMGVILQARQIPDRPEEVRVLLPRVTAEDEEVGSELDAPLGEPVPSVM